MSIKLEVSSAPAVEPVSTAEARSWLKLEAAGSPPSHADDAFIDIAIKAAREEAEKVTGRALITQTLMLILDRFPISEPEIHEGFRVGPDITTVLDTIRLPGGNVQSVTTVTTYDESDVSAVFASSNYIEDLGDNARIVLKQGASWPTDLRRARAIEIIYVAGYGAAASSVPAALRMAILEHVGHLYEHRGDQDKTIMIPDQVHMAYQRYRLIRLGHGLD